jgi:hypothetical protein
MRRRRISRCHRPVESAGCCLNFSRALGLSALSRASAKSHIPSAISHLLRSGSWFLKIPVRGSGRKPLHASMPAVSIGMTTDTGLSHIFPSASKGAVEIDATADLTLPVRYSRALGPEDRSSSDNQWFDWEEDTKLELRQDRRALLADAFGPTKPGSCASEPRTGIEVDRRAA